MQPRQSDRSRKAGERPTSDRTEEASSEQKFEILSNRRRQYVIKYLAQSSEERVRLRDMAEQLAAWENDASPREVTYDQRKRVYTSLYQVHLPKMDRVGIVEYDRSSGVVRPTSKLEQYRPYVSSTPENSRDWGRIEPPIAGACFTLVCATVLGILPYSDGVGHGIAFAVSAVFLFVSIGHYVDTRSN